MELRLRGSCLVLVGLVVFCTMMCDVSLAIVGIIGRELIALF